jgi:hypothetical protein
MHAINSRDNSIGDHAKGRKRPAYLRALGNAEPPMQVTVDGALYQRDEIFKHDSWAATATYVHEQHKIVCKFNRQSSVFGFPMRWAGWILGRRETYFLKRLAGLPGIPKCYSDIQINGASASHVAAHDFVVGQPLSLTTQLRPDFFERLVALIGQLHSQRIAYIDLHKTENVIVGQDGLPYLIDFQISVAIPKVMGLGWLFQIFAQSDLYHIEKHRRYVQKVSDSEIPRPWWIQLHRSIAAPIRNMRRRFLVLIAVRRGTGHSFTESATEVGLRK